MITNCAKRHFALENMSGNDSVKNIFPFKVGSIVRAPRTTAEKPKCRAMIAIIQDDQFVCLLWESCIPQPLHGSRFLVTPALSAKPTQDESILEAGKIESLLDFEMDDCACVTQCHASDIQLWKDRGDQLLRLGDPSSAIPYYEMALSSSNKISIGSSVICSVQGYPKIAEVDCVEDDSVDVVYVESGEETTIPLSDILIAIVPDDDDDQVQPRVLLNLARCLLQHSDVDASNRARYLKSAVLACTLVLSILSFRDPDQGGSSDSSQTALQLRVKAQMGLSKWPHAIADAKRLVKLNNPQGPKLLETIDREKKNQAKRDKKLVKAVSRWVQTATSESVSEKEHTGSISCSVETNTDFKSSCPTRTLIRVPTETLSPKQLFSSPLVILLVLIAAFLIQKLIV